MTRVRQIDPITRDWYFGKGRNDYLTGNAAVMQNINTRLYSFLGDCFFDTSAGIDWFTHLGGKDQTGLNLAISAVILNTDDVTGLLQLSISLSPERQLLVQYQVQTTYSRIPTSSSFTLNINQLEG